MDPRVEIISPDYSGNQIALQIDSHQDAAEDLLYEFIRGRPKTTGRSYKPDLQDFLTFSNPVFSIAKSCWQACPF